MERCRSLCAARARFQYTCDASVVTLDVPDAAASTLLADLRIVANSYYEVDFVMDAASDLNDVRLELDSESMDCGENSDWFSHVDEDTSLLHSALISAAQVLETLVP